MTATGDLRDVVRQELRSSRISQAQAARELGLTAKHMSRMLTGRAVLTLEWAEQILTLCGKRITVGCVREKGEKK